MALTESNLSDQDLVDRTRRGDRDAYSALVRRHQNLVYGLAYDWLGDFEDARDVAQETFVAAFRRLSDLQSGESFRPWLRGIAANACRMRRRERKPLVALESVDAVGTSPDADQRLDLYRALEALGEEPRLAIVLYYFHRYSVREIADFVGANETTIMSRLRNARARLRQELHGDDGTDTVMELMELTRWVNPVWSVPSSPSGAKHPQFHHLPQGFLL